MNLLVTRLAAISLGVATALQPAIADSTFRTRSVKVVVPYGPGTGVDVVARLMADSLGRKLGEPVVIDNRAGAMGAVGTNFVANATPDGYTLLAHAASIDSVPAYLQHPPYKVSDVRAVSIFADATYVLVASASRGWKTVDDLVAAARAQPDKITFASAGVGTGTYIGAVKFNAAAGLKVRHIPYKSTTDALTDIIASRVDFGYTQITSALGLIQAGKLVALAVSSKKSVRLPDTPSIEQTVPGAGYSIWIGLFAPAKTPDSVVDGLARDVAQVCETPAFATALEALGAEVVKTTPAQADAMVRKETIENEEIVGRMHIVKQ